jgi:2-C-methyl-D-erythritol 4-phosphate cytidylyltransferase
LLAWTLDPFLALPDLHRLALVVAPTRLADAQALCQRAGRARVVPVAVSGAPATEAPATEAPQRRDAVLAGLRALGHDCAVIVYHDATRPLVTPEVIRAGLAAVARTGAATAAEPVKETLKLVRDDLVAATLPRERLVRAQPPAVFTRERLLAAYAALAPALDPPDEAALALAAGLPLVTFPGSHENLAVTGSADLPLIESILRARSHP